MRVLLATDGSPDARTATLWLRRFPLPAGATVRVLAVATIPQLAVDAMTMRRLRDAALGDARRVVEGARRLLGTRRGAVETRVVEGDPRGEIVGEAGRWGADLVVVGARGLGAAARWLLGSVSLAVVRDAPCAVLVVKGAPRAVRRVVVGVDGSTDALGALRFVAGLVRGRAVTVHLLTAVEPPRYPASAPGFLRDELAGVLKQVVAEQRAAAREALERAAAGVGRAARRVRLATAVGAPAAVITRTARAAGADLVVVGARGLGPVRRLLLGSVSEGVLRAARCAVLIVKRPRKA